MVDVRSVASTRYSCRCGACCATSPDCDAAHRHATTNTHRLTLTTARMDASRKGALFHRGALRLHRARGGDAAVNIEIMRAFVRVRAVLHRLSARVVFAHQVSASDTLSVPPPALPKLQPVRAALRTHLRLRSVDDDDCASTARASETLDGWVHGCEIAADRAQRDLAAVMDLEAATGHQPS
jgi:hypothetical protein